eukprot:Gb_01945 [translate_table: standard]
MRSSQLALFLENISHASKFLGGFDRVSVFSHFKFVLVRGISWLFANVVWQNPVETGRKRLQGADFCQLQVSFWQCVVFDVDAVVYLVDAADKDRFVESKKELDALLSDDSLANVPFLILGNKIDIPYAASEDELRYYLGLTDYTTGKGKVNLADSNVRPIEVFMCSIVRKMGYGEGIKWLSQYIK